MTRKITFIIILILLIVGCSLIMFGTQDFIQEKFATVSNLKKSSETLEKSVLELDKAVSQDMPNKKRILSSTIEQYKSTKEEYERVVAQYSTLSSAELLAQETGKDIYDVDFLWTIVGNYATEEGVNLKFDVTKNTTSPSSYTNDSSDYVVCDLNFSVAGSYINLTDFIYDIEDDDRLNFEINDFSMEVNDSNSSEAGALRGKFVVYGIKLNSDNLIENYTVIVSDSSQDNETTNTTNTTNSTNSTTTTNSTNTSSTNATKNIN